MDQQNTGAKNSKTTKKAELEIIEKTLRELSAAVAAQNDRLEKQAAAIEKLTQVLKQFEQTFKKHVRQGSDQSGSQLDELIKLFVEYDINPQFYHEYKMLKAGPPAQSNQLVKRKHINYDK